MSIKTNLCIKTDNPADMVTICIQIKPQRIQRSRKKGWRMPDNTINVSRPGRFGNPFTFSGKVNPTEKHLVHDYLVTAYTLWVEGELDLFENGESVIPPSKDEIKAVLNGKNLACWCPLNLPCHAEVLLRIANSLE